MVEVAGNDGDLFVTDTRKCKDVTVLTKAVVGLEKNQGAVAQHTESVTELTAVVVVSVDELKVKAKLGTDFCSMTCFQAAKALHTILIRSTGDTETLHGLP